MYAIHFCCSPLRIRVHSLRAQFSMLLSSLQTLHIPQGSQGHPHFLPTGYKFRGFHNSLRFYNLLEWLKELKIVLFIYLFIYLFTYLLTYLFMYVVQVKLSPFSPHHTPRPPIPASHPRTYPLWLCPCVFYTCSLMALPLFSPIIPCPTPLWLLSICSLFQCL